MSGQVVLTIDGRAATVRLSHPGKFNAMSRAMWRQLQDAFERLQHDTEVRCVLLRGDEGQFCAGGDISEYAGFRFEEASLRSFHEDDVWGALQALLACDLPVIAQIDGHCMGAGMEIASACDIRIAGASARFGAPIAKLGFPMAPREAALIARVAGDLTAREMLLEAAVLSAPVMLQRGFLNRVVADDKVASDAQDTVRRIAALAPQAARVNKQTLRSLTGVSLATDDASAYIYADSAEHREGVAAFVEKRRPRF